jgi:hypothetical protein
MAEMARQAGFAIRSSPTPGKCRCVPQTVQGREIREAGAGGIVVPCRRLRRRLSAMNRLKDPILLVLLALLGLTVGAFFLGVLPYPFGILILLVFIVARVLSGR